MINYFEKYIKYKKKYNLINLKGSGLNSNTCVESDGLIIARDIQHNIIQEINSYPNDYKDEENNTRLTNLLSVDTILKVINIPNISLLCNLTSSQTNEALLSKPSISRHVLKFLVNPFKYHPDILTFLMSNDNDLYNYYKKGSVIIKLNKIILNLSSHLSSDDIPDNLMLLPLSIELFSIDDNLLIANKLTDFIVSVYPNSYYANIGLDHMPKIVLLIVRLLFMQYPTSQFEPIGGSEDRIKDIMVKINSNLSNMSDDIKNTYLEYFPSNSFELYT